MPPASATAQFKTSIPPSRCSNSAALSSLANRHDCVSQIAYAHWLIQIWGALTIALCWDTGSQKFCDQHGLARGARLQRTNVRNEKRPVKTQHSGARTDNSGNPIGNHILNTI